MIDERRRDEGVADTAVDAAWRSASDERPPARVDAAILAAARDAVHGDATVRPSRARHPWWTRWQPLAAAAGVVGLAFVLVQTIPRDATGPAVERAPWSRAEVEREQRDATAVPEPAAQPQSTESPVPEAPPAPPASVTGKSAAERPSIASDAASEVATAPAAMAGAARSAAAPSAVAPGSPEAWARHIAALHADGELAAAASELRAFRAAYADADRYLPQGLHDWAASQPAAGLP